MTRLTDCRVISLVGDNRLLVVRPGNVFDLESTVDLGPILTNLANAGRVAWAFELGEAAEFEVQRQDPPWTRSWRPNTEGRSAM